MKKNKIISNIKDFGLLYLIIGGPLLGLTLMTIFSSPSLKESVHWHMPISYDICGNTTNLNDNGEHGKLHGHNDKKIHIEGIIDKENRSETLGAFFDTTNIIFNEKQIGEYKNGDLCDGSTIPGKVSVLVNGKENFDFRNYILNDGDDIKVIFK